MQAWRPEKSFMARQLEKLEAGLIGKAFPVGPDEDFKSVRLIADETRRTGAAPIARAGVPDIDGHGRCWKRQPVPACSSLHLVF